MCIDCLQAEYALDPARDYRFLSTDIELTIIEDDGCEHEIVAVVEWDEADPWAITADFGGCAEQSGGQWQFSRELLKAGLHYDAGVGDVHFRGDLLRPDRRQMILDSPDGHMVFRFDPIEVSCFVVAIDRAVGRAGGAEWAT